MNKKMNSIIFYGVVAFISIILFYWFKTANNNILKILLYPHAKLTEIYYNLPMKYVTEIGYIAADDTFAIGRACMGSSFIIMMFTMTATLFEKHFEGIKKFLWLTGSLAGSVLIGVLVSCIRIIGSVPFVTNPKFGLFHSSIGIFLYFVALLASYALLKKIFRGEKHEESV